MEDFSLTGKVALVTGGAVGIGRAICLRLAESGSDVALTWCKHEELGLRVVKEVSATGQRCIGLSLDATSSDSVDRVVGQVADELGRIDIVINNAGGLLRREALSVMSDAHWNDVLRLNLTSAFYCSRAAARHLKEGGRIVNISSLAGYNGGGEGSGAYAAAKAGLFGLTRGLAKELGPRGITVNAIAPGFILDTPFHETFTAPASQRATVSSLPMGRAGYPKDVAAAVSWLCSPSAGWTTGEVVNVNGGQYFL